MNVHALFHSPQSEYAFPVSEYKAIIRLRAAAGDLQKAELYVKLKFGENRLALIEMKKRFTDTLFDYYECETETDRGRIAYYFILTDKSGKTMYYTDVGAIEPAETSMFFPFFQIPFITGSDVLRVPDKFRNSVMYQIFPDRFYTKSPKLDWNKRPSAFDFFGGDLYGAAEKLEYIQATGFDTVYLTPIFPSSTNHHYDVEDYYHVSKDFGGDEAFEAFIEKAHKLGIKVMLDGVFNHCSVNNPIFRDVMEKGRASEYYDRFIIDGDKPVIKNRGRRDESCNYQTFAANIAYMPKMNSDNQGVRDMVADVMSYWIKKYGVDGWRLDVADDVAPALWREARKAVKAADPDAIMIGEDWMDPRPYLGGDIFDSVMNYGFLRAVRNYLAFKTIDANGAAEQLIRTYNRTNAPSANMMMNFLGCHDTPRFFTLCGKSLFHHHAALSVMFFYDGIPMVYYGDELPLEGEFDPDCRRGFDWTRTGSDTTKLIKQLADMRRGEDVQTEMQIECDNGVLVMRRVGINKCNVLHVNSTDSDIKTKDGVVRARTALVDIDGKTTEIK